MRQCILAILCGTVLATSLNEVVAAGNTNGSGGDMPAYYDSQLFTINFKLVSGKGINNNTQLNTIYNSDQASAAGFDFVSVLDAIQPDGFNPLWVEILIVFPDDQYFQFTSDDQILTAYALGLIDLVPSGEVYRCSVVGPKK